MHTYTVTAAKIGYNTQLVPSVQVVSSTATPLQFSLTPIATSSIKQVRGMANGAIVRISAVISAEFASSFYISGELAAIGNKGSDDDDARGGEFGNCLG